MTALSGVTEAVIRENSSADSFQRGQQYYQQGAVWDLVLRRTRKYTVQSRPPASQMRALGPGCATPLTGAIVLTSR